ncbi:MAG: SUMF1/EgtB/PvdO family nonheme iron enzyme [Rubripirellula sp.]|nr:SUMF1/EgtB/PvdO family nonheme iron enzyme [Rubripirellula sp.]
MANGSLDPSYRWLGIPAAEQPANHYRLLGLTVFESDSDVIDAAAMRQMTHVRSYALGPHGELSQALLSEIADAKLTLLDSQRKRQYDENLRKQTRQASTPKPVICPNCAVSLTFDESSFGTQVRCSQCKTILQISSDGSQCSEVPQLATTQQPTQASPLDNYSNSDLPSFPSTKTRQQSTKRISRTGAGKRRSNHSWILAIAVAMGGVSLAVVILWVVFKRDSLGIIVADANVQENQLDAVIPGNLNSQQDEVVASETDDPGDFALSPDPDNLSQTPELAVAPFNAEQAKNYQEAWARHLGVPVEIENSIGIKFRLIPSGIYEKAANLDERFIQSFYLANCEVRQHMYQQIMGSNPSIRGNRGRDRPVTSITWNEASRFCSKLSQKEQRVYRLPRSNELEFAGLVGSLSNYSFGDDVAQLGQHAWFDANAGSGSRNVGMKLPNAWGLFDVHGNVQEWRSDPIGLKRYIGGGSWRYPAANCVLGPNARNAVALEMRSHNVGFRVLLEIRSVDQSEPSVDSD